MKDNLNWKAFRYALAVFMILVFLWWFTTDADIFLLSRKETPFLELRTVLS
jgi:hypothetical protein